MHTGGPELSITTRWFLVDNSLHSCSMRIKKPNAIIITYILLRYSSTSVADQPGIVL